MLLQDLAMRKVQNQKRVTMPIPSDVHREFHLGQSK